MSGKSGRVSGNSNWKNNLVQMENKFKSVSEVKIGPLFGGRRIAKYSYNDLLKVIDKRCGKSDFKDEEKAAGKALLEKLQRLDEVGNDALANATSMQKKWTNLKRWAYKFFHPSFKRDKVLANIKAKIEISTNPPNQTPQIEGESKVLPVPTFVNQQVNFKRMTLEEFKQKYPTRDKFTQINFYDRKTMTPEQITYALNSQFYQVGGCGGGVTVDSDQLLQLDFTKLDFEKIAGVSSSDMYFTKNEKTKKVFHFLFASEFDQDNQKPLYKIVPLEKLKPLLQFFTSSRVKLNCFRGDIKPLIQDWVKEIDFRDNRYDGQFVSFLIENFDAAALFTTNQAKSIIERGVITGVQLQDLAPSLFELVDLNTLKDKKIGPNYIKIVEEKKGVHAPLKAPSLLPASLPPLASSQPWTEFAPQSLQHKTDIENPSLKSDVKGLEERFEPGVVPVLELHIPATPLKDLSLYRVPVEKIIEWLNLGCNDYPFCLREDQLNYIFDHFSELEFDRIADESSLLLVLYNRDEKRLGALIGNLSKIQLTACLKKRLIDEECAKYLKRSQLEGLNLDSFNYRKNLFDFGFGVKEILKSIQNGYRHPYYPELQELVVPTQAKGIDYAQLKNDKDLVQKLSDPVVLDLINAIPSPVKGGSHYFLDHLSDEQVARIDFAKTDLQKKTEASNTIFYALFENKGQFHRITKGNIEFLHPCFSEHFNKFAGLVAKAGEALESLPVNVVTRDFWTHFAADLHQKNKKDLITSSIAKKLLADKIQLNNNLKNIAYGVYKFDADEIMKTIEERAQAAS